MEHKAWLTHSVGRCLVPRLVKEWFGWSGVVVVGVKSLLVQYSAWRFTKSTANVLFWCNTLSQFARLLNFSRKRSRAVVECVTWFPEPATALTTPAVPSRVVGQENSPSSLLYLKHLPLLTTTTTTAAVFHLGLLVSGLSVPRTHQCHTARTK